MRAETDVLVIGSGAAGMYAAIEAARARLHRAARRSQPDRSRRRHRDGADDGRGGDRRGSARPLAAPFRRYDRGRARVVRRKPRAPAVRGGAGLHPPDGRMGRRLGTAGRPYRAGDGAGTRPAALRLCRFPQHRPGGVEDLARGRQPQRRDPQGRRSVRRRSRVHRRRGGRRGGASISARACRS